MAKSQTERILEECKITNWRGPGTCGWCGKGFGKARRRWCSDECRIAFVENHFWSFARPAAMRRDRCCQHCGHDGKIPEDGRWWIHFMNRLQPFGNTNPARQAFNEWLEGRTPDLTFSMKERAMWYVKAEKQWAEESGDYRLIWLRESERLMRKYWSDMGLEVNHKTPIIGAHAQNGCWHHQAGLEVLCGQCHKAVTRQQIAEGLLRGS